MSTLLWVALASALCMCGGVSGLPSSSEVLVLSPYIRLMSTKQYLTLRDDETGLLTGNELLSVFYSACGAVRGVLDLLNNPVFSVLGISGTLMAYPIPLPDYATSLLNPLGIPGAIQGVFQTLQDYINDLGKKRKRSIPDEQLAMQLGNMVRDFQERLMVDERQSDQFTVGKLVEAIDYPCQVLDLFHSFINNSTYVGWLRLGDWPLPLRDPLHKLNLLGIPTKIFSSIFGR